MTRTADRFALAGFEIGLAAEAEAEADSTSSDGVGSESPLAREPASLRGFPPHATKTLAEATRTTIDVRILDVGAEVRITADLDMFLTSLVVGKARGDVVVPGSQVSAVGSVAFVVGLEFKNSNVQALRRLLADRSERHDTGHFVIEGPTSTAEAVRAGVRCLTQFVPIGSGARVSGAGQVVELADGVIERLGSTKRPQPPMTIAEIPQHDAHAVLASASLVVVLDRVSDPGNLGTIMRSAEAAGADAIVITPGSVDPYNPKVVRSSASAIFHVPVIEATFDDIVGSGLTLTGTSSHAFPGRTVEAYTDADLTGRVAIVMGNEAAGLPGEWNDQVGPVKRWLTIPHRGRSESLNVAMATTVLVFEAARQRSL